MYPCYINRGEGRVHTEVLDTPTLLNRCKACAGLGIDSKKFNIEPSFNYPTGIHIDLYFLSVLEANLYVISKLHEETETFDTHEWIVGTEFYTSQFLVF